MDQNEKLIKSKQRVQKHGEVFTPTWMVEQMLDTPGIKEACENLEATFLEPAAGEGNFLTAILTRKLQMVEEKYAKSLGQYEHFSLYALSTLYAIELLEDNVQMCSMNMLQVFNEHYRKMAAQFGQKEKDSVYQSAKLIISVNIQQGDFLSRLDQAGEPIVFSHWQAQKLTGRTIQVDRTEYSLDEIYQEVAKTKGALFEAGESKQIGQLSLFDDLFLDEEEEKSNKEWRFRPCSMVDVYLEELIEKEQARNDE